MDNVFHNTHSRSDICAYYQNVRGLNTKTHDFWNNIVSSDYPVICCTETWLQPSILTSEIICDSYSAIRADRRISELNCKRGGGVLLAVHNKYAMTEIDLKYIRRDIPAVDIVGATLKINSFSFVILVLYIPPNVNIAVYNQLFELLETSDDISNADVYIIGDFNIPEYNYQTDYIHSDKVLSLAAFCNFFGLSQQNKVPNNNGRFLDLLLCNRTCGVAKAHDVLLPEDSHHPALCFDISIVTNKENTIPLNSKATYDFRKANFFLLYQQLSLVDWSFLDICTDCDEACNQFYILLNNIFDMCVPKKISRPSKYPPWFSRDIILDIKTKAKSWREYKRTSDIDAYNHFKYLRSKIKKDISISYKQFLNNIQNDISHDTKKFWSYVKGKKGGSSLPDTLTYENTDFQQPSEIANAFALFFESGFSVSNKSIPDGNDDNINNTFSLEYISEKDVFNVLKKFKPKFTAGPDNIPAFIIRDCAMVFAYPLMKIFNLSLQSNTFPDNWKIARVCPVLKKGDRKNITNYRPITILCNFSKAFEMILHETIYINTLRQISDYQHGFIRGRSTTTNLFCITQYISEILDSGSQVDVIYTDFSKAFDRLDHGILLCKLMRFGLSIKLLNLIESYLHNRRQYVEYRGFRSREFSATSGVPQGSILGPLLFVIFINDIIDVIDVNCLLYADDMKIYCNINSIADSSNLQKNLNSVHNWCIANNLPLNVQKCNIVSFSKKKEPMLYNYTLDNVSLNRVTEFKDLGITFDTKLSFKQHIDDIVLACYRSLGFVIRNSCKFNDINILFLLFNSFVLPKLEYASVVWNPGYQVHVHSIENIQRKFLKYVSFRLDGVYPPIGIPHQELLSRYNVLSLNDRRVMHSLIFLFKIVHNKLDCPTILDQLHFNIPTVATRHSNTFYLPTPRTNLLLFSPLFNMCSNYHRIQDTCDIFFCNISSIKKLCVCNR